MNRQDIAARLRVARPVKLRVVLNDETEKPVTMPKGRNRWDKAAAIIDSMPWASVYPLDAQGGLCAEAIHRDDATPAGELEDVPKNPTMAIVNGIMVHVAPMVREIHKVATVSAVDLVKTVRSVHKDEMATILDNYAKALQSANDRATGFETRANDLLADNDELREALFEARKQQGPSPGDQREAAIINALVPGLVPMPANANAPGSGGDHGGNGVG